MSLCRVEVSGWSHRFRPKLDVGLAVNFGCTRAGRTLLMCLPTAPAIVFHSRRTTTRSSEHTFADHTA